MLLKHLSNRSFMYRYLISSIILLLIPLLILSFLIKNRMFNVLQEELMKNNLNSLKTTAAMFENDLDNMSYIMSQILLSSDFSKNKTVNDTLTFMECIDTLSAYKSSNTTFSKISVVWENIPIIYSNSGSSPLILMDSNAPLYPDFSDVSPLKISGYTSNNRDFLLFTYHLNFQRNVPDAKLMFTVNANKYHNNTASPVYQYIYYNNSLILSNTDYLLFDDAMIQDFYNTSAAIADTFLLNGEKMLLCSIPSDYEGILFLSAAPLSTALSASNELQHEFILFLIICFVFATVTILISMQWNYRPLHQLWTSTKHLLHNNQKDLNEISAIQSAINNLADQNEYLEEKNKKNIANNILTNLLKGVYSSEMPLKEEELNTVSFKPQYTHYIVCLIKNYQKNSNHITKEILIHIISQYFPFALMLIKDTSDTLIPLILHYDDASLDVAKQLEQTRNAIIRYFNEMITISAGNPYTNLYSSPESYMEAMYSMDYRFIRGNDNLFMASDIAIQEDWSEHYPKQDLLRLRRLLNMRSISTLEQINKQLDDIVNYIQTCEVPLFAARSICFEIINIVLSSMSDEELKNNRSYLTHLSNYDTVNDLLNYLTTICHNIFTLTEPDKGSDSLDLITQLKVYVETNYTDSNFSLQEMADYFNIGVTNLSQYFKRQTGQTLINYYTGLRMTYAKTLLSDTELKLDEIAIKTGYLNTSSFIRRFKQYYGYSPRQYMESVCVTASEFSDEKNK